MTAKTQGANGTNDKFVSLLLSAFMVKTFYVP